MTLTSETKYLIVFEYLTVLPITEVLSWSN